MTVSEPVLDSFDHHSNDLASKHSGADANACSRNNTVLTTAPLYELVWSKQKGLSYISASSSSADKKASLLWSTGTCNIMVSASNVYYGGDRSDGGDLEHDLSSLQSGSHMEDKAYKVTLVHSLGNACGTSGDMGEIKEKDDKFSEEKLEEDKYNKKIHYCPLPSNEFQFHDAKPEFVLIQEFNSGAGPENCPARTEVSTRKEQMSNIEVGNAPNHRNTLDCSTEFTGKWAVVSPCQEPTLARDVLPANISSASTSRATNGVPLMNVAGRMELKKGESHKSNWVGMFSSTCNHSRKVSELKKGKEPIIHDIDDDSSSSNRRDNGQESFECISSRKIVSTVKRVTIDDSELEKIVGSKRLKRSSDGNCSFMNWVTTLTNGLPRHSEDAPMELFQHPSIPRKGDISPLSILDREREIIGVSHGIVGFKSIFQSMYQPCYNVRSTKNKYVDHQKEMVAVKGTEREKQDSCAALMTENRYIIPKSLWIGRFSDGVFSGSPKAISHTNNPDSKLQLTLSSKCCKISEPMSSTFATRLDDLIHTTPLKNVEVYARANKFCLFCGKGDHSIRECSEVVETSLEHYLNTMPLYDRIKKATCFCILCFHLGHWAASCPNVSSKGNGFGDNNSESTTEKHRNHHFANHSRAITLFSGSKKDLQQVENKVSDSDFVVSPKVSKNESACNGILDLHMNRVEDATIMDKMKAASSFSSQNEATQSGLNPFCNHLSTKTASGSEGIFVFIRKLRLSRTDIIRWMKSSTRIDLTGFFLRLRIEKLEKGLGGTGYYVAHVNGESNQSSIFVCVGSSTYTVTTRFISNQDFNDDELNTWWFQKLRDGSQLPSREELNEKLQLRRKFGI